MTRSLVIFLLLLQLGNINPAFCQGLENVPPVLLVPGKGKIDPAISFILTPGNTIEIIDADMPWPPRWFMSASDNSGTNNIPGSIMDGRFQQGHITFYRSWLTSAPEKGGYIICDERMNAIDTVVGADMPLKAHDFRINAQGEKMISIRLDTVLNLSSIKANSTDTLVKAIVDIIEILDSDNNVIFRWNPVAILGIDALYAEYGNLVSASSKEGYVDWSHANSFDWDFDGNILYGFRHIGIGKISRVDGHVIWRLDRNKMPYTFGSDTLSFYLQHGFDKVKNTNDEVIYELYSNGDKEHPTSHGMLFSVNKENGSMHIIRSKTTEHNIYSIRFGNYDVAPNGNYLINYGIYKEDTTDRRFMEYGDGNNNVLAEYKYNGPYISYGVHQLTSWRPERPKIEKERKDLKARGNITNLVWYELNGTNNLTAKIVGYGSRFTPAGPGIYCVAVRYGIGWSVSIPYYYK